MDFGRQYYLGLQGGHQEIAYTFTGAETKANLVAGDTDLGYRVDRVVIAGGASAVTVHLEDGGTQVGPKMVCPANDTIIIPVIVDYDDGAGIDVQSTGACDVYVDYHNKGAGG